MKEYKKYLERIKSVFIKDDTEKIYKEREERFRQLYSDENTYDKIVEDALNSTGEELVSKRGYSVKKAANTLWKKVVVPFKISHEIYNRAKNRLVRTFTETI